MHTVAYFMIITPLFITSLSFYPYISVDLNFFNKHKAALETRMSIRPLLIELEGCGILNDLERETVEVESTSYKQNHALIVLLSKKGSKAQERFYDILKKKDSYLVEDLEN